MNVWIINPFDNLPSEGNRPQRYWLMSEAFAYAGHQVTYWTSDFSHATKRKRVVNGSLLDDSGIKVIQIPTLPYAKNVCLARVASHQKLAKDFTRLANQLVASNSASPSVPSLIIASTPPLGLCAAAMDFAKKVGAKFVCDIQDAWPETFERLLPRSLKWLGLPLFAPMRARARKIYREANFVTGVCSRYAKLSGRDDFYLAYHGIGGDALKVVERGGKREGLVYAGNLGAGYDLTTVIAAVAKREGLTLDIAGMGPEEPRLRSLVDRLGLTARVRFHGYLGKESLANLLSRCAVGVIPMRDDSWVGLPYKLTDYLQAGLRVISSLHGECGDLLAHTRFGTTYDWGSVTSLLAALDALPEVEVSLPDSLRAETIYPNYVQRLTF